MVLHALHFFPASLACGVLVSLVFSMERKLVSFKNTPVPPWGVRLLVRITDGTGTSTGTSGCPCQSRYGTRQANGEKICFG
jgi:hypothetical protein